MKYFSTGITSSPNRCRILYCFCSGSDLRFFSSKIHVNDKLCFIEEIVSELIMHYTMGKLHLNAFKRNLVLYNEVYYVFK